RSNAHPLVRPQNGHPFVPTNLRQSSARSGRQGLRRKAEQPQSGAEGVLDAREHDAEIKTMGRYVYGPSVALEIDTALLFPDNVLIREGRSARNPYANGLSRASQRRRFFRIAVKIP